MMAMKDLPNLGAFSRVGACRKELDPNKTDADQDFITDLRWLNEGKKDPHPQLLFRERGDLGMASFSDEELAGYAFMNYNRSQAEEVEVLVSALNPGPVPQYPKIAFMTSLQERVRWLSRRLAIAEGRYPTATVYLPLTDKFRDSCPAVLAEMMDFLFKQRDWKPVFICKNESDIADPQFAPKEIIDEVGKRVYLEGFAYSGRGMEFKVPYTGPDVFETFPNVVFTPRVIAQS